MLNPRLAGRYAKSIIDLAVETNKLEEVYADMQYLKAVMKSSREFVVMLKSPVIPIDKKNSIITAIAKNNISELTTSFLKLLISKNREFYFPEIVDAFLDQYNSMKGIQKVKLTTAVPVSDQVKEAIIGKLKLNNGFGKVELETSVKEELIGGFVLEFNNNLVDASIQRDLRDIKAQFQKNVYVQQIR